LVEILFDTASAFTDLLLQPDYVTDTLRHDSSIM